MNIINKDSIGRDPFEQTDRGGFGRNAGKGDFNRSMTQKYRDNYPETMGQNRVKGKFRKAYRS